MPAGKTIIHATLDPMDLNKDVAAQYGLIGDARLTLTALSQAMDGLDKSTAAARAGRPAPRSPGCAAPGWRNGRPSWRTTPRRSTPTG